MNTQQKYQDRIIVDPKIMVGKPVVKWTRIPVEVELERLAEDLRWVVRNWASRIGVKPARVQVRPMQTKWASISTSGSMTLDLDF